MLKFHVDLQSVNAQGESEDVKFKTIVSAESAEAAEQKAQSVLKKEQPELTIHKDWQWAIFEMPG